MRRYNSAQMYMTRDGKYSHRVKCDFCDTTADFKIHWSSFRFMNICASHWEDLVKYD